MTCLDPEQITASREQDATDRLLEQMEDDRYLFQLIGGLQFYAEDLASVLERTYAVLERQTGITMPENVRTEIQRARALAAQPTTCQHCYHISRHPEGAPDICPEFEAAQEAAS